MQTPKYIIVDLTNWPGLDHSKYPLSHCFSIGLSKLGEARNLDLPLFYYDHELYIARNHMELVREHRRKNNPHKLPRNDEDIVICRMADVVGFVQAGDLSPDLDNEKLCLGLDVAESHGVTASPSNNLSNTLNIINPEISLPHLFEATAIKQYSRWMFAFNNIQNASVDTNLQPFLNGERGKDILVALREQRIYLAPYK